MTQPIIAGIDLESTGLLSPDHRIIEYYIALYKGSTKIFEYNQRIDPQRSIGAEAQRVHGITASDLIGKPSWEEVAGTIATILGKADYFVWHNGDDFDGPFTKMELGRVGLTMPDRPSVDTMQQGVWATPDGKKPRLSELAFACGVDYDPSKAHAADYDVQVMMDCYFRGLDWNFFVPPEIKRAALAA